MRTVGMALVLMGAVAAVGAATACDSDDSSGGSSGTSGGSSGTSGGSNGTSGGSSGTSGGSSGTSGGSPNEIVTTAADKPEVTPCPSKDLLTDATKIGALKSAMSTGAISYLDVPYDGGDPDILKKKCGLEGFWNPTDNVDAIPVTGAPNLSNILTTGNGGICSDGFTNFGSDEGFPVVGVYRKEIKAVAGATTYHVRARITTSGSAAGQKFSALGITNQDIQSNLVYEVNGTATAHDNLWSAIVDGMAAPAPSVTLDTKKDGSTLFTSKIELICAAQL